MGKVNNADKSNKEKFESFLFIVFLILTAVAVVVVNYFITEKNKEKDLPYTELITQMSEKKIEKIVMTSGSTTVDVIMKGEGEEKDRTKTTMVPSIQPFVEFFQEKIDAKETDL